MREIKFRVWHTLTREMLPVRGLAMSDGAELFDLVDDSLLGENIVHNWDGLDIRVLMQYTGLKDKNGKEIYEGDIVSDDVGFGKVVYGERRAAHRVTYGNGWAKWFNDYTDAELKELVVIGNIYEHPHLLKEDKHETRD